MTGVTEVKWEEWNYYCQCFDSGTEVVSHLSAGNHWFLSVDPGHRLMLIVVGQIQILERVMVTNLKGG